MQSEPAPKRGTDECRADLPACTPNAEPVATVEDLQQQLRRAEAELSASVTERKRIEAQLVHRLNNLLSIMITYTSFTLEALKPGDAKRTDVEHVARAGERAVALTRQLLAFGQQLTLRSRLIELNGYLAGLEPSLRHLLGESIELSLVVERSLGHVVSADPGQLELVITSLVGNARDAMPDGGKLTIEATNVTRHASPPGQLGPAAGEYVRLTVSDTGSGIDAATRAHIFEPFFTTKELGRGNGMGLAIVLAIVEESDGHVDVFSEPGEGSTFQILLPRVESETHSVSSTGETA
jgi:two-component system cell cycle sensor histidine kinase/response regulator CckA